MTTLYKHWQKISDGVSTQYRRAEDIKSTFTSHIRTMQIFYESYIWKLKDQHQAELKQAMYEGGKSTRVEYDLKIENLKLQHKSELQKKEMEFEQIKAMAVQKASEQIKQKYEDLINQNKMKHNEIVAGLKNEYNNLSVRYENSQAVVKKKEELIKQMEKTHKEALANEKKLAKDCSAQIKAMMSEADDKKARNRKLMMGGAGLVGAYMMMKE
jgi:hypothetical protein